MSATDRWSGRETAGTQSGDDDHDSNAGSKERERDEPLASNNAPEFREEISDFDQWIENAKTVLEFVDQKYPACKDKTERTTQFFVNRVAVLIEKFKLYMLAEDSPENSPEDSTRRNVRNVLELRIMLDDYINSLQEAKKKVEEEQKTQKLASSAGSSNEIANPEFREEISDFDQWIENAKTVLEFVDQKYPACKDKTERTTQFFVNRVAVLIEKFKLYMLAEDSPENSPEDSTRRNVRNVLELRIMLDDYINSLQEAKKKVEEEQKTQKLASSAGSSNEIDNPKSPTAPQLENRPSEELAREELASEEFGSDHAEAASTNGKDIRRSLSASSSPSSPAKSKTPSFTCVGLADSSGSTASAEETFTCIYLGATVVERAGWEECKRAYVTLMESPRDQPYDIFLDKEAITLKYSTKETEVTIHDGPLTEVVIPPWRHPEDPTLLGLVTGNPDSRYDFLLLRFNKSQADTFAGALCRIVCNALHATQEYVTPVTEEPIIAVVESRTGQLPVRRTNYGTNESRHQQGSSRETLPELERDTGATNEMENEIGHDVAQPATLTALQCPPAPVPAVQPVYGAAKKIKSAAADVPGSANGKKRGWSSEFDGEFGQKHANVIPPLKKPRVNIEIPSQVQPGMETVDAKSQRKGKVLTLGGYEYLHDFARGGEHQWRCRRTGSCMVRLDMSDDGPHLQGKHTHGPLKPNDQAREYTEPTVHTEESPAPATVMETEETEEVIVPRLRDQKGRFMKKEGK
ncbi:uncharacterized protein LOC129599742 isoform X1 [Paramacrobiotus metropolitanus]|uniref:uncharacterized protein LOC129599742 isoform X1 n=1 Tax=Paramacrobiotus metropolitanus TaxID=2943436 RepID=UPI002445BD34|nr:uncharacterized protein LOC129599742 isoform X1 [Paramacrobiotus metropolitanus]